MHHNTGALEQRAARKSPDPHQFRIRGVPSHLLHKSHEHYRLPDAALVPSCPYIVEWGDLHPILRMRLMA
eukprot:1152801-Pelagomonas_calceolata.AAC.6